MMSMSSDRGNRKRSNSDNSQTYTSSSSTTSKSRKSSNSDSPSQSANNIGGRIELDQHIKSVLSHPLGLALLLAFHDNVAIQDNDLPSWFNHFHDCKNNTTYDKVLAESVADWRNAKRSQMTEPKLTELMESKTKTTCKSALVQGQVKLLKDQSDDTSSGYMDMVVVGTKEDDNTPSLVIQVGLNKNNWFKKLYQGMKYLELLCLEVNAKNNRSFKKPQLLAIVTLDKDGKDDQVDFQIGVFLCWRKDFQSNNFRMSLLWHFKTDSLEHASKLFGRTLVIAQKLVMERSMST